MIGEIHGMICMKLELGKQSRCLFIIMNEEMDKTFTNRATPFDF